MSEFEALVAVDIGNSRLKFGLFETPNAALGERELPVPRSTLTVLGDALDRLAPWIAAQAGQQPAWFISSVNRTSNARLLDWLAAAGLGRVRVLSAADLPLEIALERPEQVGNDRLAAAVAANRLREAGRAAIVVALGTAITVNLISTTGSFQGGAILPGLGIAARALHEMTDLLPLVDVQTLSPAQPALGKSTIEAMRSGLYWGAVGAIRELIGQLSSGNDLPPQIFVTGGAAETVVQQLGVHAQHEPHLTLAGIALTAAQMTKVAKK